MVAILTDFAIAGALILVSQMLRAKIKFLQSFFIPASLLAGLIALILGNQVLGVLNFSDYSGDLHLDAGRHVLCRCRPSRYQVYQGLRRAHWQLLLL